MALPEPEHEFCVPSLHDGNDIQCRLYHPESSVGAHISECRAAVVAHPYAPLGGSFDDPVVALVASTLLAEGYIVGTFNFRGAGESEGRTSWSSKPELKDYVSVVGLISSYAAWTMRHNASKETTQFSMRLVLAGYSYGSLITSQLPSASDIVNSFQEKNNGTARIIQIALRLATGNQPAELDNIERPPRSTNVTSHLLLVSPLLPPLKTLLRPFSFSAWSTGDQEHRNLTNNTTMAIFGDQDDFTSGKRLRTWGEKLVTMSQGRFRYVQVETAGHFWHEAGVADTLKNTVQTWLRNTCQQDFATSQLDKTSKI